MRLEKRAGEVIGVLNKRNWRSVTAQRHQKFGKAKGAAGFQGREAAKLVDFHPRPRDLGFGLDGG